MRFRKETLVCLLLWVATISGQTDVGQPSVDTTVDEAIAQIAEEFGYQIVLETPEFADALTPERTRKANVYETIASLLEGFDYTLVRDSSLKYRLFIVNKSKNEIHETVVSEKGLADFEPAAGKPTSQIEATVVSRYKYEINEDGPDGLSEAIPLPRENTRTRTYQYEVNPDGPDGFSESIPIRAD